MFVTRARVKMVGDVFQIKKEITGHIAASVHCSSKAKGVNVSVHKSVYNF